MYLVTGMTNTMLSEDQFRTSKIMCNDFQIHIKIHIEQLIQNGAKPKHSKISDI